MAWKKIGWVDIEEADQNKELRSDNLDEEIKRLSQKNTTTNLARKITQIVATFGLGILAVYYSIKYQSLWLSVGIHTAWNLLTPIIIIIIALITALIITLILSVFWKLRDIVRNKRRRFKKQGSKTDVTPDLKP